jgi:hypothetical protein
MASFVIILTQYPGGLLYEDLDVLEELKSIKEDWPSIVESLKTGNIKHEIQLSSNWIEETKESKSIKISLNVRPFLEQIIQSSSYFKEKIISLEYLSYLSYHIIEKMIKENVFHEKILEFNVAAREGI